MNQEQYLSTTTSTTVSTPASSDSVPVRTLSVRRNAQAINVLVSNRKPSQYPEMMRKLFFVTKKLESVCSSSHGYSCLEVGAREGRLLQCWPKGAPLPREYVALERNPNYNPSLRASMKDKHVTGSIVHSRRPPNEIESLRKRTFDLILFSHSLYWTSAKAAAIVHETVQNMLDPNHGVCLIFHHAFGFYSLWHLMDRQFARDTPLQVQPHASGSSAVQLISALKQKQQQERQQQDDDNALEYTPVVAAMDPCPLYLNGLNDSQWNELLSFIFQIEAAELPSEIREEAVQLVMGSATQTSASTNALSSSSHNLTDGSSHTRRSAESVGSALSSSSHHYIDGERSTTQMLFHDTTHEYWLHHPHVTIKITREEDQYYEER